MDGILIVNKEKSYTSHDVVAIVKKIAKIKVGHTGTLDPMATGVLPLLLGEGTKLSKYLIEHDKVYEAVLKLGQKTDTADSEGKVILEKEVNTELLHKENVEKVLKNRQGKQLQTPPMYSAIKINGKKLYEYARKNETVEIPKREIEIYAIELLDINIEEKTISFKVHCSKGTYIRSLCETIAEELGTVGYMKELNRIKVGNFSIEQAVSIENIKKLKEVSMENAKQLEKDKIKSNKEENTQITSKAKEFCKNHIISIEQFFQDKPKITLTSQKLALFLNGVKLETKAANGVYAIYKENDTFVGTGIAENGFLKRDIII